MNSGEKVVSVPAITITGGAKAAGGVSNIAKMASQDSGNDKQQDSDIGKTDNRNSQNTGNQSSVSRNTYNSGFDSNISSAAHTSNRNISSTKISENKVTLNVPKDLESQVFDIAKVGDLSGKKTEDIVNEILRRDKNLELLDGGKYGSNNGFDHVFRNKNTGEVWILDSKQIPKSGNMSVSNKGVRETKQMSPNWIREVNKKLDVNNPTRKAIEEAIDYQKINTGLVGVDKKTGELIFVPVRIKDMKK